MHPAVFRSLSLLAAGLTLATAASASAQTPPQALPQTLKARCAQLIAAYDRHGSSRSANSDGFRNHTRIGAAIDCIRGNYEQGIREMEDLLRRKKFTVPPPPA